MIRFFRTLRQRLLAENRTGHYLLYALGEIILVVIGILIALQANNWNEERNHALEVRDALRALQTEIAGNIDYLDLRAARIDADLERVENFLGILTSETPEAIPDSVLAELIRSVGPLTFIPLRQNAYRNLINSGTINHVKDDSLKLELIDLERVFQVFDTKQNLIDTNWEEALKPYYLEYGDVLSIIKGTLHKKPPPNRLYAADRNAFINNRRFANILTQRILAGLETQRDFLQISRRLQTLQAHIPFYLNLEAPDMAQQAPSR